MDKIGNLGKKIYLICYNKPRYELEISNIIYGYESKGVYPEIKKLERNNWIEKADKKTIDKYISPEEQAKQNAEKRKYYFANVEPLYNYIFDKLTKNNITLNDEEKNELKTMLNTDYTSEICENIIKNYDLNENIDLFPLISENINMFHAFILTVYEHKYVNLGAKINEIPKKPFIRVHKKLSEINLSQTKMLKNYFLSLLKLKEEKKK